MVEVATTAENDSVEIRTVDAVTEIREESGAVVATDTAKPTVLPGEPATTRQRPRVRDPPLRGNPGRRLCTAAR
ncbi:MULTISPECIES: hypothetical protein [unclassified Streptomyces]|uniref:hypothetical protein n=1 Tax=unclassified Streptomyces TaxID=2593676 RepID=UPI003814E143